MSECVCDTSAQLPDSRPGKPGFIASPFFSPSEVSDAPRGSCRKSGALPKIEVNRVWRSPNGKMTCVRWRATQSAYFASHADGLHPDASEIFLKGIVLTKGRAKYFGSLRIKVTTR